jgi:fructose-1,6-bisphosphatase II
LLAGLSDSNVDLLMGVGGIPEGIIAACALKATGGAMVGRLRPQSDEEQARVIAAGLDVERIFTTEEIVRTDEVFFAATGITDGPLLSGVRYDGTRAESNSLVMRGQTSTRRIIRTKHLLCEQVDGWKRYIPGRPFR